MFKAVLALCLTGASAYVAPNARRAAPVLAAAPVDETVIGVQAPAGFWDPLGLSTTQPEGFERRRAVERKHGRISMVAFVGILVHNADIEFPGYLSKSQGVKFSDIPDGIAGFSKIPSAGILQILLLTGIIELAWWPASNYSGDYGVGFFGTKYEGEEKLQKLNAEMANGRLAMLGVAGNMLAEGQIGMTFKEQLLALNFNPFA
mmetsp:Transcript_962/g.2825  ORF Transcript_962/g.2825 Transcript_962/m.2825 type:complete len:204 (+) Transcript_962:64-675(+)